MNTLAIDPATTQDPPLLPVLLREAAGEFLKVWRTPAFALPTLVLPAGMYVLFALLLPGGWGGMDKATYLLATYGVFGIMGPALFGFGAGVAQERENGWLDLKRVAPMPVAAYFFGKIAMSMLFALAVILLLSSLALAGGVRIAPWRWLGLVLLLVVAPLPFCALGLMIGSSARAGAAVAIVNLVYLPLSILSGLWMPIQVFPGWLQSLAAWLPPRPLAEMALHTVGIGEADWTAGLLKLLGWTVVFVAVAAWLHRRGGAAQD
jgi:ABC-2 type transport system permease protein